MRRVAILGGCAIAVGVAAGAPSAFAQDTAAAAALFQQGLTDMQAGSFEKGCPALEESYRLDPAPGVLFTSAECHAQWGKFATAVARYEDYLRAFESMSASQRSRQHGRDEISKQKLEEIRPLVPELTLVLPENAPEGTIVQRGGARLGRPSLGVPIPVDPGEHVLSTRVPGGPLHEQRITLEKAEKKRVELTIVTADESAAPAGGATSEEPSADGAADTSADAGSSRRTLGYVAGGIGIAGVVVGAVTGGLALGKKGTIDEHCDGTACDHEGKQAADSAQSLALISTIGFGIGIVGLGAGAVLLLTAPSAERTARPEPHGLRAVAGPLGSRGGYLGLAGAW